MSANSPACNKHPGWQFSRDCIRDTLIAKRTGVFREGGFAARLCTANLRLLRETQLARHLEVKMVAGRYLQSYRYKKNAPDIVVVLRGGMVQAIHSTNPYAQIFIADYDIHEEDSAGYELCEAAEDRVARGDMHEVY